MKEEDAQKLAVAWLEAGPDETPKEFRDMCGDVVEARRSAEKAAAQAREMEQQARTLNGQAQGLFVALVRAISRQVPNPHAENDEAT